MTRSLNMTMLGAAVILAATLLAAPAGGPPGVPAALAQGQAPAARRQTGTLSPQLIERCLEVAREVDPQLAETLTDLRKRSPGREFERAIRDARHLISLARLKEEDPTLYGIKVQELRLDARIEVLAAEARQARAADSAGAEKLEDELRGLVREQAALSIATRGMALRRLRDHLKTLQDQLNADSANFEQTVDRRLEELLGP